MANNSRGSFNVTFRAKGRGAGSGGRGAGNATAGPSSRGRGGRGRGGRGGRSRGGRGANSSRIFGTSVNDDFGSFNGNDEDDEICGQAVGQVELETSSVCKAFLEANEAEDLPGFDKTAGQIWIYPTNRPVRDYQFEIVKTALFNNTLVTLPTGLGKTFIAAVLMYNFHRWYPQDLVIFMAPTRPLVTQQLEACHQIVGISPSRTVEMTGQIAPKKREELWKTKSVFFLTPQVMTSDLAKGACPAEKVRCVVVDEAHKALGQHAYVQVISMLVKKNVVFRVLALSATPGSDLAAVQQVFKNLLISKVELRSETSPDLLPYRHDRTVDKIVVPLDDYIQSVHSRMVEVFQLYTGKLMKQNAINARDGSSLSRFQLLKARESFRQTVANRMPAYQKGYTELDFSVCISLAHSLELLVCHGLRTYYNFLQGVFNKEKGNAAVSSELNRNTNIQSILTEVREKMGILHDNSTSFNSSSLFSTHFHDRSSSASSSFEEDQTDYLISHPKMRVLKDIIMKHFTHYQTRNETTRVMIFSQYRDSVQEIGKMLATLGKLVKPMVFIGQSSTGGSGKGLKQKDQVQVVQRFRNGGFNVLVSTCVGEEGLDIGEVDLIICFDASKSPTRLVQRMGRTGRQREGKIIFLLTKGKEERNYSAGFSLQNSISKNITDPSKLEPFLYKSSPRMVPKGIEPECFKMSVILTCEQENSPTRDDVITIDDDDDDTAGDFLKPAPKMKGKNKKQASKSVPKVKNAKGGAKKASSVSSSCGSTQYSLTQCFEALIERSKKRPAAAQHSPDQDRVQVHDNHEEHEVSLEGLGYLDSNDADFGYNGEYALLNDIFDVVDPSTVTTKPCIYIPRLPPIPLVCSSRTDEINQFSMLSDFELECLRERLETIKLVSPFKEICECGNRASQSSLPPVQVPFIESQDNSVQNFGGVGVDNGENPHEDIPFPMDDGFIFDDDNDLNLEDDWDGETDNCCPNKLPADDSSTTSDEEFGSPVLNYRGVQPEKTVLSVLTDMRGQKSETSHKKIGSPVLNYREVQQQRTILSVPTDMPRPRSETSHKKFGSPVLNYRGVQQERTILSVPTNMPRQDSEGSSTSFEDDSCPVRVKSSVDPLKESQFRTKSQVDRNLFKDDLLLFESDEEFLNDEDLSNTGVTAEQPSDVCQSHTSCYLTPTKTKVPGNNSPTSDLSPDLSQFRLENRIKRVQEGDTDLLVACSQMFDPNDPNGKIVTVVDGTSFSSPTEGAKQVLQSFNESPFVDKPAEDSECTFLGTSTNSSFKKKFTFKKKSLPALDSTSSSISLPSVSTCAKPSKPRRKRRKLNGNPFLDVEADAEDDSSSMDENDEFEGLDDFDDSFVVPEDDSDIVTDSQQVRYIRSVRDIEPMPFRRPLMPPPVFNDSFVEEEEVEAEFESDSFCVTNDDVEYADIGVFTQAMNVAKEQIRHENPGSAKRRQTRRHVRQKQAAMGSKEADNNVPKKIRKRVIQFDDSSDED